MAGTSLSSGEQGSLVLAAFRSGGAAPSGGASGNCELCAHTTRLPTERGKTVARSTLQNSGPPLNGKQDRAENSSGFPKVGSPAPRHCAHCGAQDPAQISRLLGKTLRRSARARSRFPTSVHTTLEGAGYLATRSARQPGGARQAGEGRGGAGRLTGTSLAGKKKRSSRRRKTGLFLKIQFDLAGRASPPPTVEGSAGIQDPRNLALVRIFSRSLLKSGSEAPGRLWFSTRERVKRTGRESLPTTLIFSPRAGWSDPVKVIASERSPGPATGKRESGAA